MSKNSSCIILFIKAPIAGQVKTRLAESIGHDQAVKIYRCFIKDIIRTAAQTLFQIKLFYHPPGSEQLLNDWLGNKFDYYVQIGSDLGEKMTNAFQAVFEERIAQAVLIGSDIPDLPKQLIDEAFLKLKTQDAVIGPSNDGGFYLIGFRSDSFSADVFKDIKWSRDTVYVNITNKLDELGLGYHILPQWRDIDTHADLMELANSLSHLKSSASETLRHLQKSGISVLVNKSTCY